MDLKNREVVGFRPIKTFRALPQATNYQEGAKCGRPHMGNLVGMVETGESRTPRPETPLIGYATSLFGDLISLLLTPADEIQQRPADEICGPNYRRPWGSIPE